MNAKRSQNFGREKFGLVFLKPLESRCDGVGDGEASTLGVDSAPRREPMEDITTWPVMGNLESKAENKELRTVKSSGFDNVCECGSEGTTKPVIESKLTYQMT
jgi:hypothetical protein